MLVKGVEAPEPSEEPEQQSQLLDCSIIAGAIVCYSLILFDLIQMRKQLAMDGHCDFVCVLRVFGSGVLSVLEVIQY